MENINGISCAKADPSDKLLNGGIASDADPPPHSKEVVLNDVTNTGVMSALIGGFALSNVQSYEFNHKQNSIHSFTYVLLIFAVHACTCSALTSAILYRTINRKSESAVPAWCARGYNWMILLMPMAKFGMGTIAYIAAVLLMSFVDLIDVPFYQSVALAIGLGSMSTVVVTTVMLHTGVDA